MKPQHLIMTYSLTGRPLVVARAETEEEAERALIEAAQLNPGTRYQLRAPNGEQLADYEHPREENNNV